MTQLDMSPIDIDLRCIDHTRNKRRFYRMTVQRDLFGDWILIREWGRIGRAGRIKCDRFGQAGAAAEALQRFSNLKRRRGYKMWSVLR
jgi:predicted DNA-binding WGR domain protein